MHVSGPVAGLSVLKCHQPSAHQPTRSGQLKSPLHPHFLKGVGSMTVKDGKRIHVDLWERHLDSSHSSGLTQEPNAFEILVGLMKLG